MMKRRAWESPLLSRADSSYGYYLRRVLETATARSFFRSGRSISIGQLVAWNREMLATDPRDTVFALCGLADDSTNHLLKPDYSISNTLLDIFRRLAEHSIIRYQDLDIICLVRDRSSKGWPS